MPRIARTTNLVPAVVDSMAEWYAENRPPSAFRSVDPLVLKKAARLAGGDWQRCLTDGDGSIVVCRRKVW